MQRTAAFQPVDVQHETLPENSRDETDAPFLCLHSHAAGPDLEPSIHVRIQPWVCRRIAQSMCITGGTLKSTSLGSRLGKAVADAEGRINNTKQPNTNFPGISV
jgi:hypothetical protein